MNRVHTALCALALLAFVPVARAADPAAEVAAPKRVAFSALPLGEISKPPPRSKLRRPSGSRAEGFYFKRPHKTYFTVSGGKIADDRRMAPSSSCLRSSQDSFGFHGGMPTETGWALQSEGTATLSVQQQPMVALHREEVRVSGDRTTLETRDAVVDTSTLASKTIDQRSLPLSKVGEMVGGVQVFAMRGADRVEFIVLVPETTMGPQGMLVAHVSGEPQMLTASQCRHLRVTAPVKKGEGTAAIVQVRILDSDPHAAPPKDDGSGTVQRTLRTLAVNLSTSWLSSDGEPVVSATSGWHGPSEKQRVPLAMAF